MSIPDSFLPSLSSTTHLTTISPPTLPTMQLHQQQEQMPISFAELERKMNLEEYADGQLSLSIERLSQLLLEQKSIKTEKIARFSWELGALKHNILDEDNIPKPYLLVYVQCNERSQRLDGWTCTARIKLTFSSVHKKKSFSLDQIRFSTHYLQEKNTIHYPWDKLLTEFELSSNDTDTLNISAKITIIEQIGYGSLIQLNTRLNVNGSVLLVNKFHLATYSPYFQTFFFSDWTKTEEYHLDEPNEDLEILQLMFNMAYPTENYPHPTDARIGEVLRLADKYDLQIVSERCEKLLMEDTEKPLIQKLALAEHYSLFNLKSHCLERITPAQFCLTLRENIAIYNELSDGLKLELDDRMAKRGSEEIQHQQQQQSQTLHQFHQQQQQDIGTLPPPHKRVRPRPKTPPRPNYNLPPFRFK